MFYTFHALIFFYFVKEAITIDYEYETIKTRNSSKLKFVPLSIKIDFQVIDKYYPEINKKKLEFLKQSLINAKSIYESLLSVNYQYHIITPKNNLGEICKNKLLNGIGTFGYYTNLIILPILEDNTSYPDGLADYNLCIYNTKDNRPLVATLTMSGKILLLSKEKMLLEILHTIFHILGFNQKSREKAGMKNFCKGGAFENVELKKVYKKYMGTYPHQISLFDSSSKYIHWNKRIFHDIMSSKTNKTFIFSEYSLRYLQNLKFYRVNMNICGCSLKGECSNAVIPYEIHINLKTFQLYCYQNMVYRQQCIIYNNIYYFNLKKYNDKNFKSNTNYFSNKKCTNFNIIYDYNVDLLYKELIDETKFKNQKLFLVSPIINKYCKCHLKTVYLFNKYDDDYNKYVNKNYKIEEIDITDLNKLVYSSFTDWNILHSESFREVLEFNNIEILNTEYSPNFLFSVIYNDISFELLSHQTQYTIFKNSQFFYKIGDKNVTYRFYNSFRTKFPKDFDFMPETYIMPIHKNLTEKIFKNYIQKENDLWLCKPCNGSLGEGIYFLKDYQDILNCTQMITKYIHNPHLYKNRKYHIRLYNFISSIKPLIIYIFKEGQVMTASHDYKKNLEDINDKYSFLTNAHINFGKDGYHEDIFLEQLKEQIIKDGGNWDEVWRQIKDICIKIIIMIYNDEYNQFNNLTYYNEKSFIFFGLDMMIDTNYKVWFLEANDTPHMEGYDKVNKKNKIGLSTDIINILGLIPFDHSNGIPIENNKCIFKNKIEEKNNNVFCQFNRPKGKFERIFPVKETISYYKKFFKREYEENKELWKLL